MKKNIIILLLTGLALVAGVIVYSLQQDNQQQKARIASLERQVNETKRGTTQANQAQPHKEHNDSVASKGTNPRSVYYDHSAGYHWIDLVGICDDMHKDSMMNHSEYPKPADCVSRDDRKVKYGSITKDVVVQWCAKHHPNTKAINITATYGVDSIGSSGWRCMEEWATDPFAR